MAPTTDLPDDVQAEARRRRTRWLGLLAALLVTALVLSGGHQYPLARVLAAAAVL
ncbi:hypothetical protein ACQPZ8_01550 [Actinomadura nitritigenes]|uniref:hypothetical protein n=1 Tax=Actinomadura nitritigenes TaxID=134602 RepID=UPI003D942635